jgi:hypothetical protein
MKLTISLWFIGRNSLLWARYHSLSYRRRAMPPPLVTAQPLGASVADVQGQFGEDVVGIEVAEAVVVEGITLANLVLDTADGEVHLGRSPGRTIQLLATDKMSPRGLASVAVSGGMGLDEPD